MKPGTLCIRVSKFKPTAARRSQELRVRKLTSDGQKAIVHSEICVGGMVQAVELSDLIHLDEESGFWVPAPRKRKDSCEIS